MSTAAGSGFRRRVRRALVLSAVAAVLAGTVAVPATGASRVPERTQAATPCTATQVGASARQPVAGSTAVLFVHGFVSYPGIWAQGPGPTLPVQTAALPGLTAWTFDYSAVAANWVTDPKIGPALAATISCLAAATGGPVVVVGHSMGGLATRFAVAQTGPDGAPVGSHVAELITLGTPFEGSDSEVLAEMTVAELEKAITSGGLGKFTAQQVAAFEAERSACAGAIVKNPQVDPCNDRALSLTPAGRALKAGSPQLAALPPWPADLPVFDTAGDITEVFQIGPAVFSADIGDGPVTVASATSHNTVGQPFVASTCHDVDFLRLWKATDSILCYHHNLPFNPEIDAAVMGQLRRYSHSAPAGLIVQDEPAAKVSLLPVTGDAVTVGAPILGPDGRIWFMTVAPDGAVVYAVDPKTMAESSHPLAYETSAGKAAFTGEMAFDGTGKLWVPAAQIPDQRPETDVLLRYSVQNWAVDSFSAPAKCATGNGRAPERVTAAGDGAIWVRCVTNDFGAAGGTYVERRTPDGAATPSHVVLQGKPGDLVYLGSEELPAQALSDPMAALSGGVMWTTANGSIVTFAPDGSERLLLTTGTGTAKPGQPAVTTQMQLFTNGSAPPVELSECLIAEADQASHDSECFVTVSQTGELKVLTTLPDDNGYNLQQADAAAMDHAGTDWVMLKGTAGGKVHEGQYYIAVGSDGHQSIYPFTATGGKGLPVSPDKTAPVITSDGGLWTTASDGQGPYLMEVLPKR
ncbi:MAG: alpha/beta hydrolase [Catenulispora sp.]|nr:alpha/beta hydrolase [Catenulispora sp.]